MNNANIPTDGGGASTVVPVTGKMEGGKIEEHHNHPVRGCYFSVHPEVDEVKIEERHEAPLGGGFFRMNPVLGKVQGVQIEECRVPTVGSPTAGGPTAGGGAFRVDPVTGKPVGGSIDKYTDDFWYHVPGISCTIKADGSVSPVVPSHAPSTSHGKRVRDKKDMRGRYFAKQLCYYDKQKCACKFYTPEASRLNIRHCGPCKATDVTSVCPNMDLTSFPKDHKCTNCRDNEWRTKTLASVQAITYPANMKPGVYHKDGSPLTDREKETDMMLKEDYRSTRLRQDSGEGKVPELANNWSINDNAAHARPVVAATGLDKTVHPALDPAHLAKITADIAASHDFAAQHAKYNKPAPKSPMENYAHTLAMARVEKRIEAKLKQNELAEEPVIVEGGDGGSGSGGGGVAIPKDSDDEDDDNDWGWVEVEYPAARVKVLRDSMEKKN